MSKPKLLILDDYEGELAAAPAMGRLRELAEVRILDRLVGPLDLPRLAETQILFALRERTRLDARFFAACPNLELVLQSGGHAYHIDQAAATQRGILVALGRRVTKPTVVVPELVFALLLGLVRQIASLSTEMRNGTWPERIGGAVAGRTLGILGYGRIGQPVARLAQAFGMQVVAWDRTGAAAGVDAIRVRHLPLGELLSVSDVVTIHLRLSDESRNLLNRERLWQMKPGALLINTARGAIVDEVALVEALRTGQLGGAGLDVFTSEPLPADSPLRALPNVLLTPHIGWKVQDVLREFVEIAADQLQAWLGPGLAGSETLNPDALQVPRKRRGRLSP